MNLTVWFRVGLRRRRRSRQVAQILWSCPAARRSARDWQDRARACNIAGAWCEGPFLPHGRLGGVQHGGEKDRSPRGGVPASDRCVSLAAVAIIDVRHLDCAGLRIKETKEVYEGEVTELTPTESENPLSGYGKTVSHVIVGLKTVRGTKQLRLDPSIYEAILKEKIQVGDVIYVEANTGAVKVRVT